jgi:hypothetical protein
VGDGQLHRAVAGHWVALFSPADFGYAHVVVTSFSPSCGSRSPIVLVSERFPSGASSLSVGGGASANAATAGAGEAGPAAGLATAPIKVSSRYESCCIA